MSVCFGCKHKSLGEVCASCSRGELFESEDMSAEINRLREENRVLKNKVEGSYARHHIFPASSMSCVVCKKSRVEIHAEKLRCNHDPVVIEEAARCVVEAWNGGTMEDIRRWMKQLEEAVF